MTDTCAVNACKARKCNCKDHGNGTSACPMPQAFGESEKPSEKLVLNCETSYGPTEWMGVDDSDNDL
eukprot:7937571-Pyramimonas_sp.AAC.1